MNTQENLIKQSQLLNQLVLDRNTTEELGRVEQLWLDTQSHQLIGLTCKAGILGSKKRSFTWSQIDTIGKDSILVNNNPKVIDPEKPKSAVSLIGHEIWTDAGNNFGKLIDYLFVPQTGAVVNYLFVSNGWRGVLDGIYLFTPTDIISTGSKRVIVKETIAQSPQFYSEGLNQKVNQAADFLKEDYEKTKRDLESIRRGTQEISGQVQEVADKAKEKLSEFKTQSQPVNLTKTITKDELPLSDVEKE